MTAAPSGAGASFWGTVSFQGRMRPWLLTLAPTGPIQCSRRCLRGRPGFGRGTSSLTCQAERSGDRADARGLRTGVPSEPRTTRAWSLDLRDRHSGRRVVAGRGSDGGPPA